MGAPRVDGDGRFLIGGSGRFLIGGVFGRQDGSLRSAVGPEESMIVNVHNLRSKATCKRHASLWWALSAYVVLFEWGCLTNAPCGRRGCKSCSRARISCLESRLWV